mgnify:CR=1 FL=1
MQHQSQQPYPEIGKRDSTLSSILCPTSYLVSSGSSSVVPVRSIKVTRLVSTLKPLSTAVMSLATIKAIPLRSILSPALSTRFSLSAANPTLSTCGGISRKKSFVSFPHFFSKSE